MQKLTYKAQLSRNRLLHMLCMIRSCTPWYLQNTVLRTVGLILLHSNVSASSLKKCWAVGIDATACNVCMYGQMDGWVGGWVDEWMDGWMEG
jgi:hypothetical protein